MTTTPDPGQKPPIGLTQPQYGPGSARRNDIEDRVEDAKEKKAAEDDDTADFPDSESE